MATKLHYDTCTEILRKFVDLVRESGTLHGMTYSFSPRKVQIDYLSKQSGIMIRKDKIFVLPSGNSNTNEYLERVFSESGSFQRSCTGEYFCDKAMEELIIEVFAAHADYIKDSLLVGYWDES